MKNNLLIGEFSRLSGLSIETLRYYEKENILKPHRNKNNLRRYSDKELVWIEFVKKFKAMGMSIKDIALYAALIEQGHVTLEKRKSLLEQQLRISNEQLQALKQNIKTIQNKLLVYDDLIKKREMTLA